MKFSIRRPKQSNDKSVSSKPEVNRKKVLLISVASLLVLAVVLGSIGLYQRHQEQVNARNKAQAAALETATNEKNSRITKLEGDVLILQNQKQSLCQNYDTLSKARATRTLVVVPTPCTVPLAQ